MSPQPIVVATDFSPSARNALTHAARIAAQRGAPLHIITVIDREHVDALAASVPFDRSRVEAQVLERGAALLDHDLAETGLTVAHTRHIEIGRPADTVRACCEKVNASLLIVGYHGKTEQGPGPGSVARKCVRHAPCDVLLVRRAQTTPFRSLAVGVDFSDETETVIHHAAETALGDDAAVTLLHAHTNPFDSSGFGGFPIDTIQQYDAFVTSLRAEMDRLAGVVRARGVRRVEAKLLLDPNYGRAVTEWCREHGADLAVIGTLGKSGLRYWLLGSTAERVVEHAACSVLAVRRNA